MLFYLRALHTDGVLGDVEDDTTLSVVEVVRHTALDGRVGDNINIVTTPKRSEVLTQSWHTLRPEGLGQFVPGTGTLTERVRHLGGGLWC